MTIAVEDSAKARPTIAAPVIVADEPVGEGADGGAAEKHLQRAEAEDQPPQGAQALPGQLDADGEEQEHDAEFGKVRGPLLPREGQPVDPRIVGRQPAEAVRARATRPRRETPAPG